MGLYFVQINKNIGMNNALSNIYEEIAKNGFNAETIQIIDTYINDILYGTTNFYRFNLPEHAGFCNAGPLLIGASIIASYATASLESGSNASESQGRPANWQIDELQEQLIEQWARAKDTWIENSEQLLIENFGEKIAQGAEAKVYYKEGDIAVVKERASIYSTTQKALDAIALHNYLFPETVMRVIGFTRDSERLFRIILTQPYVTCQRLATKAEIDNMAISKGFRDNWNGEGVNYILDRIALEDMHPANVFIDSISLSPVCIDCIVKFTSNTIDKT